MHRSHSLGRGLHFPKIIANWFSFRSSERANRVHSDHDQEGLDGMKKRRAISNGSHSGFPLFSIEEFLQQERGEGSSRFSTAGSVTTASPRLIGRLLYDTQSVYRRSGAFDRGEGTNRSRTDRLRATNRRPARRARAGITIDVAYRYFSTARRPSSSSRIPLGM